MSVRENIGRIRASLPEEVTLVAVSKFHPAAAVQEAYNAGQRIFGESRAQELRQKQPVLPEDIQWHFIGTLQSNKVKDIVPYIHTIHSIDSFKLLQEIEKQAAKYDRTIRILLEIHVAQEESKHGFTPEECLEMLETESWQKLPHVEIAGVMGMATYTEDEEQIRAEFRTLASLFHKLKENYFAGSSGFDTLSMGMSHDYSLAIEEGSNMIRVGTAIFGDRI